MKKTNSSTTKSDPLLVWLDWTLRLLGAFLGITMLRVFFSDIFRSVDAKNPNLFVWVSIGYLACCIFAGLTFEPTISLCGLWRSIADLKYGLQMPFLLGEGLLSPVIVIVGALVLIILIMLAIIGTLLLLFMLVLEVGDFNAATFEVTKRSPEDDLDLITALDQESRKALESSYLGTYSGGQTSVDGKKFLVDVFGCSTKNDVQKLKQFIISRGYQVAGVKRFYMPSNTLFEEFYV